VLQPGLGVGRVIPNAPRLINRVPLLLAALAMGASLQAQSTGLFVNSSNNVGIGTASPARRLEVVDNSGSAAQYITQNGSGDLFAASTGSNERFRITNSGNVGIGTTSPTQLLHLWAPANINAALKISSDNGGANNILQVVHPAAGSSGLQVQNGGGSVLMQFDNNTGNVGIGTTNPGTKLEIDQNGTAYNIGYGGWWSGFRTSAQTGVFGFQQNDRACFGLAGNVYNIGFSANSMGIFNGSTTPEDVYLINQNGPSPGFMVLKASGNVGIGTASPGYRLDVAGAIHASEIITNNYDWADYVFKPAYKLASLSEVEGAIKRDGHLPGMPSAADVAAHGLNMGEMQAKLLQKIEELTLHQIDQEKRIEQLEKENTGLRERAAK